MFDLFAIAFHQLFRILINVFEHIGNGVSFIVIDDGKLSVFPYNNISSGSVAEKIVHIAEYFLICSHHKKPKSGGSSSG